MDRSCAQNLGAAHWHKPSSDAVSDAWGDSLFAARTINGPENSRDDAEKEDSFEPGLVFQKFSYIVSSTLFGKAQSGLTLVIPCRQIGAVIHQDLNNLEVPVERCSH